MTGEATSAFGDSPPPMDATTPPSAPRVATGAWGTLAPARPAVAAPPRPATDKEPARKPTAKAGSNGVVVLASMVAVLAVVGLALVLKPLLSDGQDKGDRKTNPVKPVETDPEPVGELKVMKGHDDIVLGVAFSADGSRAVSASMDRSVRLWNLHTGRMAGGLKNFRGPMACVAWSPVQDVILCAGSTLKMGEKKIVCLWTIAATDDSNCRYFEMHDRAVLGVAFSADGSQILSAGGAPDGPESELFLWDTATGKLQHSLKGHQKAVRQVAFVPKRKLAVSCGMDRTIRIWNLETGQEVDRLPDQGTGFSAMAVSPDGETLLAARMDAVIQLWKITDTKAVREVELSGHQDAIRCVAYTPDGKRAVSCGDDRTVRVWDLAARKELLSFTGHTGIVTWVAVAPDGRRVLSASEDKTVRLWALPK